MEKRIYLLSPALYEGTVSLPMIAFKTLSQTLQFENCDILMFTSKQAVISAEKINPEWKDTPCLAIGPATARQIERLGAKVAYQPDTFYGKTLSQDIVKHFKEKKILYLRPKEVSFDSKGFLEKEGILIEEKVIYETQCITYSEKNKPLKNAIIIFTSPSTIHCFFKNFTWDESYTAVIIGKATEKHLPAYIHAVVADEATIDACIEKAKVLCGEGCRE